MGRGGEEIGRGGRGDWKRVRGRKLEEGGGDEKRGQGKEVSKKVGR